MDREERKKRLNELRYGQADKKPAEGITGPSKVKSDAPHYPDRYQPLGGFLPFAPDGCTYRSNIIRHDGIDWIDMATCNKCPKGPCDRLKQYSANKNEEHQNEMRRLFGRETGL